jgi:Phage tail sheath C-terminal domain/Phage tail sheath protein subtilisin-like domain
MRIPSISFIENNVGFTPIRQNIRNRIGIVSTFSRGSTTPTFITGDSFFANNYGYDTSIGSLAYQAARDQGAEDFLCVRVLGNAKPAKGQVTFTGIATKANTLYFNLKFIGLLQEITNIPEVIVTSGEYTGSVSGRYFFKVTDITTNVATIKYKFIVLGEDETIDWGTVTDSIEVDLTADKGIPQIVANGISVTFGQVGQTNDLAIAENDEFKVRVNSYVFTIPINENDIPYQIATNFISAVSGLEVLGEITLNSANNGVVFELDKNQTDIVGTIGNRFSYYFTLLDTASPGITTTPALTSANAVFMSGGEDGARVAYRDFYSINGTPLLRLQANYVGDYGNNIRVSLYPDSQNSFRLEVSDLNAGNFNPRLGTESYVLNFNDLDKDGLLNQLSESIYIKGIFLPKFTDPVDYDVKLVNQSPIRLAPADITVTDVDDIRHLDYYGPAKLLDVSLEDGYDGPAATDDDYIKAINALEAYPVHIVLAPGKYSSTIQQALLSHCEKVKDKDGLRVAILNARPNLSPNAAKQETVGLNSQRGVKVAGWATYAGQPNSPRFGLSPDALYAGLLAAIPFFVSPHARKSAGSVRNITEVDTFRNSSSSALQLYTDAKLEVLHVDPATQAFFFTTGRTISSDPAWEKIYVRRSYDFIRQDLYDVLSYYIGEPHTLKLRVQIQVAVEQYLRQLAIDGMIANFENVLVGTENNPPGLYTQGQLNVSFEFLPLYAVDYIQISIIRNTESGLAVSGT